MSGRLHIMRPKLFIAAAGLSLLLAIPVSLALKQRDNELKSQQRVNHSLELQIKQLKSKPVSLKTPTKQAATPPVVASAPVTHTDPPPPPAPAYPTGSHEDLMTQAGISSSDFAAVDYIVTHESGWRPDATEPNSGAHGLPQALPYSKTGCGWVDAVCQLKWANNYAVTRYGSWWVAQAYWQLHRNW